MADEVNIKLHLCPNDTYGLYETMHSLNEIIDALWKLSDTDYYLNYVFNGYSDSVEMIKKILSADEIDELASKFESIRAIVLSEVLSSCPDDFKNFEYAILQSAWEQKYSNNKSESIDKYEKGKAKVSYNRFVELASEIKKYYQTRYGEEIEVMK